MEKGVKGMDRVKWGGLFYKDEGKKKGQNRGVGS